MRSRTLGIAAWLVAFATAPALLSAQASAVATIGERVRVTSRSATTGRSRLQGQVVALSSDSLTIQPKDGASRVVAISDITWLAFSNGTKTNKRRGMFYGLLAGAAIGGIVGIATYHEGTDPECLPNDFLFCSGPSKPQRGIDPQAGVILGGLLGGLVGGIYGQHHHSERWTRRALGGGRALGLVPFGPTGGPTVSMRF